MQQKLADFWASVAAMFSPGPKSRTTAAFLAFGLGWAGVHKFYLCYRGVGVVHLALTWLGVVAIIALNTLDGATVIGVNILAWLALLAGYFYVRRFHFGHSMQETVSPAQWLLWPWRLMRHTFFVSRVGSRIMEDEEEERRERRYERRWRRRGRGRRRRRYDDDDDDGGSSLGCWVIALGIVLCVALALVILFVYYIIFSLVGIIAIAGSVILGATEGFLYLKKTDDEFESEYVTSRRLWF